VVVLIVDSAMRSVGITSSVFVGLHCCRYSIQCERHVARSVVRVYEMLKVGATAVSVRTVDDMNFVLLTLSLLLVT
jgi:hypothetical protein